MKKLANVFPIHAAHPSGSRRLKTNMLHHPVSSLLPCEIVKSKLCFGDRMVLSFKKREFGDPKTARRKSPRAIHRTRGEEGRSSTSRTKRLACAIFPVRVISVLPSDQLMHGGIKSFQAYEQLRIIPCTRRTSLLLKVYLGAKKLSISLRDFDTASAQIDCKHPQRSLIPAHLEQA